MWQRSISSRSIALYVLICCCLCATLGAADHVLRLDSVQRCDSTGDVVLTRFNLTYYKDNETIAVDLAGTSKYQFDGTAHFDVLMFGAAIYQHDFSLCTTSIPQICPIPSGPFNVTTWIPAPSAISQSLPAFLFGLPDLGVETKLTVTPTIGSPSVYLCIVAGLSNDPQGSNLSNRFTLITPYITTTSIVVTALAFLTGLVGLVVAILYVADVVIKTTAAATGTVVIEESYNSVVLSALAPAAPGLQDLVMYCQHIAFTGQFQLAYPNFYRTFAANFAWSLGIVSSPAILSAVDTMRAQYGGHPDQDLVRVDQDSSNLGPNISSSLSSARIITFGHAVAANVTLPPTNVKLLTGPENSTTSGIAAYLYALRVPTADAFMTVLLVFLMILGALTVVMMIGWGIVVMLSATVPKLRNFAHEYGYLYSGYALRLIVMAYSSLLTYAFFQFMLSDSWLSLVLAVLCIVLLATLLALVTFQLLRAGHAHITEERYQLRFGFLYADYRREAYRFFVVAVAYTVVKAALVGLAQGSPWTQAVGNLIVEVAFFSFTVLSRPYEDFRTNVLQGGIAFTRAVSAMILFLFVGALAADVQKKTVGGLMLIVVQGLVSVVLYVLIVMRLVLSVMKMVKGQSKKSVRERGEEREAEKAKERAEKAKGKKAKGRVGKDEEGWKKVQGEDESDKLHESTN